MSENLESSMINAKTESFFDLIQKVGSNGKYQRNVFLILLLNWFLTACIIMATPMLFLNQQFDCHDIHGPESCQDQICSDTSKDPRDRLLPPQIYSLAIQFGPFICQQQYILSAIKMSVYIGLIASLAFIFFTDNLGRRSTIIISWAASTLGLTILSVSINIQMASAGLIIAGAGAAASSRICMPILAQITETRQRQLYSVALQLGMAIGAIALGVQFLLIRNWRTVTIFCFVIPSFLQLFLLIWYVRDTPKFLIKKNPEKAIKKLNQIGKINKGEDSLICMDDIDSVISYNVEESHFKQKIISPLDFIKYPSLRWVCFGTCLMFFCMDYAYFGPLVIIDKLGLNVFINQIVIGCSQLVAYPASFVLITNLSRKKSGYFAYGTSGFLFICLYFVQRPDDCDGCWQGIVQIALVFLSRLCIAFYAPVMNIYTAQLYPQKIRGLGFGMACAMGSIASASGQIVLYALNQTAFKPTLFLGLICFLGILAIAPNKETVNSVLTEQIQQIWKQKKEYKSMKDSMITNQKATLHSNEESNSTQYTIN